MHKDLTVEQFTGIAQSRYLSFLRLSGIAGLAAPAWLAINGPLWAALQPLLDLSIDPANTLQGSLLRFALAGLVMTHSRMGNTAFFASLAIAGVLALLLSKRSTKATIILIISLIIIDIFVVGTFFGIDKVAQRLQTTSEKSETRDEVNTYTLGAIQDNLLTGTGAGTYYTNFSAYRQYDAGRGFYDHAHNDYFEFACDYGAVVTGCLMLAVLWTFISAIRAQIKRKTALMRGIAFSATMAIIALAIHSTVDFNLQIPANAATFVVILALGQISLYQKSRRR